MKTLIPGDKIVLRPYRMEDAAVILQGASHPTLRRLTGTQATFTLEQTEKYVARQADADDRAGFIIAEPETLAALGEVVILDIDPDNRCAHIRITLFDEIHLGKGYGTEAMRLAVDYGFRVLKLHRIGLDVFDFNPRAIRVYEKIGFKQEGIQRDTLFYDGEYYSSILMSILEDDWREKR
ncbi:MAG: GNAT family N-acetyltransferase [Anaerolineae bacterium]|nr:GNAT family N-acetyltransferase [Anaerolineae bacterium]